MGLDQYVWEVADPGGRETDITLNCTKCENDFCSVPVRPAVQV